MHDDVIKWKHFPNNWPFVRGIHRSPVNSPYKGQWRGALMFPLICVWINDWVNNCEAGDLRRYRDHYDVTVMECMLLDKCVLISMFTEVCSQGRANDGPVPWRMLALWGRNGPFMSYLRGNNFISPPCRTQMCLQIMYALWILQSNEQIARIYATLFGPLL